MSQVKIDLDDAVAYLRELLFMTKPELLREAGKIRDGDKVKKSEILVHAFERKFNPQAKPPAGVRPSARFGFDFKAR